MYVVRVVGLSPFVTHRQVEPMVISGVWLYMHIVFKEADIFFSF